MVHAGAATPHVDLMDPAIEANPEQTFAQLPMTAPVTPLRLPFLDAPLTDGVVVLRLPGDIDIPVIYTYGQDPDIEATRWLPIPVPCPYALAMHTVQEFQQGWRGQFGLTLVITTPPLVELRGVIHLTIPDDAVGEIAYGVAPQHRRCGLATRAVLLLTGWAITHFGLSRLEIGVTARGLPGRASQRVAEKAGFSYAGLRRSRVEATGSAYEDRLYTLLSPAKTGE